MCLVTSAPGFDGANKRRHRSKQVKIGNYSCHWAIFGHHLKPLFLIPEKCLKLHPNFPGYPLFFERNPKFATRHTRHATSWLPVSLVFLSQSVFKPFIEGEFKLSVHWSSNRYYLYQPSIVFHSEDINISQVELHRTWTENRYFLSRQVSKKFANKTKTLPKPAICCVISLISCCNDTFIWNGMSSECS